MEEISQILDIYYSTLYWKAFFYGILIPSLMFSVYYYFTLKQIEKHFEEHIQRIDKAYNDLIISKQQDQIEFLESMIGEVKENVS